MTESIKLTADDFGYIHWDKDSGGPELFELIIYGKSEYDCDKIKQQILENQEIVEKIKRHLTLYKNSEDPVEIILKEILGEKK